LRRKADLEKQLAEAQMELEELDATTTRRERTGRLAGNVLAALRDAASEVVEERLRAIEPLLQRVYAAMDPHPALRTVRFLTTMVRGRGHLSTSLDDQVMQLSTTRPAVVLSSSQLNALAVAVFLSFNLGMPGLPLETGLWICCGGHGLGGNWSYRHTMPDLANSSRAS
jgi:hypothetical protein